MSVIAVSSQSGVVVALTKVIAELPSIGKDDKSPEGYTYRGIEAITKRLQPLLAKHGVVICPKATLHSVVASPAMKDGWQDAYVSVEWVIYGPDGSFITAQTNGVGRDRSDKMLNKAQTQAFKYLLLDLLCIADTADDADGATYEHDRAAPPDPDRDEAIVLFERIKQMSPEQQTLLGEWKAADTRKLNVKDLTFPEWRALVVAKVDELTVAA